MSIKSRIKNYLIKYPKIFIIARYIRWLPKNIKDTIDIKTHRILHFKEIIDADIVLSIGNHCQAAYYMDRYNLRRFSSPIDWMKNYSLDSIIALFNNDFRDFFANHYEDNIKAKENGKCRWVVDKNNEMIARHHFLKELPLEAQFDAFQTKQIQRFEKIRRYLNAAKNIVFVSCREDSIEELSKFLKKFQELYNANLTIVNFRNDKEKDYKKVVKIDDKLKIIEYCFDNTYPIKNNQNIKDIGEIVWIGHYKKWGGGYEANKTFKYD